MAKLEITPIMNSPTEEIFAFKTCCGIRSFDQNLEIHVRNRGVNPVVVPGYFDLRGEGGTRRVSTLMPAGACRIAPGELRAFYCYMDEGEWRKAEEMIFYDSKGNAYPVSLFEPGRPHGGEVGRP
jgi:hypothetical protein